MDQLHERLERPEQQTDTAAQRLQLWRGPACALAAVLLMGSAFGGEAFAQVFTVQANNHSVSKPSFPGAGFNTHITVTRGQLLVITAAKPDTWSIDPDPIYFSTANGLPDFPITLENFTFAIGSLIGSLDGGNTFFAVGTLMQMTVLHPGTLRLYFWDVDFENNVGSMRVEVKVYNPR
jgi:hypothetical protein